MNRRILALLGGSLTLAFAATFGVYRLTVPSNGAASAPALRPVVVLVDPISAGTAVTASAVRIAQWPQSAVPATGFTSVDSVVGRVALSSLSAGAPVLTNELAPRGAAPGLEIAIGAGLRAMAVRVSEALGTSGLLHAGSRVDVLVTLRDGGGDARPRARVLMSDVRVLAVGPPRPAPVGDQPVPPPSAAEAAIVTLEVSPSQAEQLAVVESQGSIQLALRGFGSRDRTVTPGASMRDLLGLPTVGAGEARPVADGATVVRTPAPAPTRARALVTRGVGGASFDVGPAHSRVAADTTTVRIYRGDKLTVERFEAPTRTTRRALVEGETRMP